MSPRLLPAIFAPALILLLASAPLGARDREPTRSARPDEVALHEFLEGTNGRREVWDRVPELVILGAVVQFASQDFTSVYRATGEVLTARETTELAADLTLALSELTGGRIDQFASVRIEPLADGETVSMFRRGQVVVGRFEGVRDATGTLGYGGRTAKRGTITAGAVMLDSDFDTQSDRRRVLRTHELAHALGYNHVQAKQSIMNPHVGSELTTFDRSAIEFAHGGRQPAIPEALPQTARR